jgi:hypothetical protein
VLDLLTMKAYAAMAKMSGYPAAFADEVESAAWSW